MIVTTTESIENFGISSYEGIVFGEVISGITLVKDNDAGLLNKIDERYQKYENILSESRGVVLEEMKLKAVELGADAIVGVKMDYETLGSDNGMIIVTCSGTAVKVKTFM
jgi:uncharacterized protein YbjQ (UPF0145 family)